MVLWLKIPFASSFTRSVRDRIHRHAGDYPYPQPQANIGFDDVGIGGGKNNARRQARTVKRGIQFERPVKPKV